jgi:DNA modification methylase
VTNRLVHGDCTNVLCKLYRKKFMADIVIADPPYGEHSLINTAIALCASVCRGPMFFFMYAEDLAYMETPPEQVLFWTKPPSTKNTVSKYSRFVEVICAYNLKASPFHQDTYWHTRSGIFTDTLAEKPLHPHQKPASLIEKLLLVNASAGDMVLDPFAGTGTVGSVAEILGMNSLSIEVKR